MPGVPLYDGHGVLHPEVDGGGGGLVVVVLGGAALVLPTVRETGKPQPQLRHPHTSGLVNLKTVNSMHKFHNFRFKIIKKE